MRKIRLALLLTGLAFAQTSSVPEIRGRVVDSGLNAGLPGAQVTITDFVDANDNLEAHTLATLLTDSTGGFSFKPSQLGNFRVDVNKLGYGTDATSASQFITLNPAKPSANLTFRLVQPASLTGTIIDEDGKPVPTFQLQLEMAVPSLLQSFVVVTDEKGVFFKTGLVPGGYLVRVGPEVRLPALDFSMEQSERLERDTKVAYWPGDVPDLKQALPVRVIAGQQTDLGTITIRKTDYYRVHVSVANCEGDEQLSYHLFRPGGKDDMYRNSTRCRKDFVLPTIESGSYTLAVSTKRGERVFWATAPVEIADKNVHVDLTLSPGVTVPGRFIVPEGQTLPFLRGSVVLVETDPIELGGDVIVEGPNPDGTFVAPNLPWDRYLIAVFRMPPTHYVKEIRYDHRATPDGIVTLSDGVVLGIVLDNEPASISGSVTDFDKTTGRVAVVLRRRAPGGAVNVSPLNLVVAQTDDQSRFTMGGLAPGEYEIESFPGDPRFGISEDALRYNPRAQTITLDRGDRKTVDLKLTVPSR